MNHGQLAAFAGRASIETEQVQRLQHAQVAVLEETFRAQAREAAAAQRRSALDTQSSSRR
jgi:hypothetical protein